MLCRNLPPGPEALWGDTVTQQFIIVEDRKSREEGRYVWWIEPMAHLQMAPVATLGLVWIGIDLAALQQIHVRGSYLSRVV